HIMDSKFTSRKTLQKCRVRENETQMNVKYVLQETVNISSEKERKRMLKKMRRILYVTENENARS
ncbi:16239_t:CDS:1, partial [Funneliformis geosporum]